MARKRGFTFVELLIALTLFSVGMISVVQIFPVNRKLLAQSASQSQAAFLAQERMEYLRSLPFDSLTAGTFDAKAAVPYSSGTAFVQFQRSSTVEHINASYGVSATETGLKRLTVTVFWTEYGAERSYVLSTYDYES